MRTSLSGRSAPFVLRRMTIADPRYPECKSSRSSHVSVSNLDRQIVLFSPRPRIVVAAVASGTCARTMDMKIEPFKFDSIKIVCDAFFCLDAISSI